MSTEVVSSSPAVAAEEMAVLNLEEEDEEESFLPEENDPDTLDLSSQGLEKLSRAAPEWQLNVTTLILDDNKLQRLDNIHTFQCIEKLSAQNNLLLRMFQVSKLSHLKILNLAHNSIVSMEGLKELKLLTWLSLASNNVKGIEHLNQNVHLEHLDLSDNAIPAITDLSYLKNLKTLLLHKNRLTTLRGCDRFLPFLSTLTLNDNQLGDLADVSHLSSLPGLEQLTLANNPCIEQPMEDIRRQFDYRPYVINWCLGIRVLDGVMVGAKESLKAEWMYSQSKGRHFGNGQHTDLLDYLVQTCPLHPDKDWQEDKKLNLILSKVQEHQSSLRLEPGLSPRGSSSTLPRSFNTTPSLQQRRNSGDVIPSSPRSGGGNETPNLNRRRAFNVRSAASSRTSPSPVRRSLMMEQQQQQQGYRVALPKTLYGDDTEEEDMTSLMSQSMDPSRMRSISRGRKEDVNSSSISSTKGMSSLMTESCDPSMLGLLEARKSTDVWASKLVTGDVDQLNRPNSLFEGRDASDGGLYLQELSDGEMTQSRMYSSRSKQPPRLNPVPESLNSPDVPVSLSRNVRRDDPLLYMTSSMHYQPVHRQQQQQQLQQQRPQQQMTQSLHLPKNGHSHNGSGGGYASSSDQEPTSKHQQQRRRPAEKPNMGRSISVGGGTRKPALPNKQVTELKRNSTDASSNRKRQHQMSTADDDSSSHSESEDSRRRVSGGGGGGNRKPSSPRAAAATGKSLPRSQSARLSSPLSPRYTPERYSSDRQGLPAASLTSRPSSSRQMQQQNNNNRRPESAPIAAANRSNTLGSPNSVNARRTTSQGSHTLPAAKVNNNSSPAATTIQKHWRGHQTRNKDENVQDLKKEIRTMRTEEHIKFLTKELQSAKQSLEQERKLRALQMDAIKVLWKEVQMMDATKAANSEDNKSVARPSGSFGSKISSRSSEHSIAKLMETLEATAGTGGNGSVGPAVSKEPSSDVEEEKKRRDAEAVLRLNQTCNTLQTQVEQLQSSLSGMMRFMSSLSSNMESIQQQRQQEQQRTRHSSSTSTQDTASSFQFYSGPGSLPPSMFTSLVDQQQQQQQSMYASLDPTALTTLPDPKSPRPSTLPGLNEPPPKPMSPPAPVEVKAFARNLVEGLLTDTIAKSLSQLDLSEQQPPQPLQSEEGTDISLSLARDDEDDDDQTVAAEDNSSCSAHYSSHVETDSLEENSPKKAAVVKND